MNARAYYNEHDPFAAAWLRELIKAGLIAPGEVDERSIEDVAPADLDGFNQVHLFAGIGVWSYAMRCAGWRDDWDMWSISCPCQPFSAAGKGAGFADERHLWPAAFHLIRAKRPVSIVGEQVASADGLTWLDVVEADLEGAGYTFGAVDTCAAGFGAPHIRQRLYWVAEPAGSECGAVRGENTPRERLQRGSEPGRVQHEEADGLLSPGSGQGICGLAHHHHQGLQECGREPGVLGEETTAARREAVVRGGLCTTVGLADSECDGRRADQQERGPQGRAADGRDSAGLLGDGHPRPTHGHWRDADWLFCRDGKWRPVEPGTFPLAHGAPARVGRLRGYGNALNAAQAEGFVRAYMSVAANYTEDLATERGARVLPLLAGAGGAL